MQKFREHSSGVQDAGLNLTKEDIFYYVYGVLNSREYRECYAAELKKQLPRVPFAKDFWAFSQAGRQLAELHLNYETGEMYNIKRKPNATSNSVKCTNAIET